MCCNKEADAIFRTFFELIREMIITTRGTFHRSAVVDRSIGRWVSSKHRTFGPRPTYRPLTSSANTDVQATYTLSIEEQCELVVKASFTAEEASYLTSAAALLHFHVNRNQCLDMAVLTFHKRHPGILPQEYSEAIEKKTAKAVHILGIDDLFNMCRIIDEEKAHEIDVQARAVMEAGTPPNKVLFSGQMEIWSRELRDILICWWTENGEEYYTEKKLKDKIVVNVLKTIRTIHNKPAQAKLVITVDGSGTPKNLVQLLQQHKYSSKFLTAIQDEHTTLRYDERDALDYVSSRCWQAVDFNFERPPTSLEWTLTFLDDEGYTFGGDSEDLLTLLLVVNELMCGNLSKQAQSTWKTGQWVATDSRIRFQKVKDGCLVRVVESEYEHRDKKLDADMFWSMIDVIDMLFMLHPKLGQLCLPHFS